MLASEAFVALAGDEFAFRLVDKVAVKGREEAVLVYGLLGLRAESAEAIAAAVPYERALEAYFAGDFVRAIDLLRSRGDDPPSRVLLERCEGLARDPPAEWDGVYVAASK